VSHTNTHTHATLSPHSPNTLSPHAHARNNKELFDRIVQRGAFTEGDAAVVTRGVLSALAHLHAHGVMHRDVKPENLLLANSFGWEVRLSDFGLVRVLGAGPKGRTGKGRSTVIPGHLTASGASSNASTTSDPAQEEEEAVANAVAVASPPAGALAPLVLAGAAAGDASTNRRALKPQTSSSSSVSVTSSNGGDLSPLTDADDYASSSSTANSSPRLSYAHLGSDDTDSGMTGGDGDNAAAAAATAAVASAAAGSASGGGGGGGGCGGEMRDEGGKGGDDDSDSESEDSGDSEDSEEAPPPPPTPPPDDENPLRLDSLDSDDDDDDGGSGGGAVEMGGMTLCGSSYYIAPEIMTVPYTGYTPAVDLWSAGVVLYIMLVGSPPFERPPTGDPDWVLPFPDEW